MKGTGVKGRQGTQGGEERTRRKGRGVKELEERREDNTEKGVNGKQGTEEGESGKKKEGEIGRGRE